MLPFGPSGLVVGPRTLTVGLIGTVVAGLLATLLVAEAQTPKKTPRVAIVFANAREADLAGSSPKNAYARAFLQGMSELGWLDGKNITIERRSTEGRPDRLADLAGQLVTPRADVIVLSAGTAPIIAVKHAIGSVPLVWLGTDPDWIVRVGLAQSLARPGGTVTGLTSWTGPELLTKRLQLLREALPGVSRVAYLSTTLPIPPDALAAARALSLTLVPVEVAAPEDFDRAFAAVKQKQVAALFLGEGWFFQGHIQKLVDFPARERLPTFYRDRLYPERGGLMSYGTDWFDIFRRAPVYVDKILRGARPGDLPIEQPTKFELVINLKTAKALGLTIPSSLLLRADEVIQ